MGDVREAGMLLCRVQRRRCAIPLEHVSEIMRPLPVEPLHGAPASVSGLAIIRGAPVPVVDLALLLSLPAEAKGGAAPLAPPTEEVVTRYVVVRAGSRQVAVAVDAVDGVTELAQESVQTLPPLLSEAHSGVVSGIGTLDAELLLVLGRSHWVPESVWSLVRDSPEKTA